MYIVASLSASNVDLKQHAMNGIRVYTVYFEEFGLRLSGLDQRC